MTPPAGLPLLEEIPFPGHAHGERDWGWYKHVPEHVTGVKDWYEKAKGENGHPCTNHPGAVGWLLDRYRGTMPSHGLGEVFDPMGGIGTVMWEARRRGLQTRGKEIRADYKALWLLQWDLQQGIAPPVHHLVVTSPEYHGANHHPGTSDPEQYRRKHNSRSGEAHKALPDNPAVDVGGAETMAQHVYLLVLAYMPVVDALEPGGHFIVIVRDRIDAGQPIGYPTKVAEVLQMVGLEPVGAHPRKLAKSQWYQNRAKLKKGEPFIGIEWALVYRKPARKLVEIEVMT